MRTITGFGIVLFLIGFCRYLSFGAVALIAYPLVLPSAAVAGNLGVPADPVARGQTRFFRTKKTASHGIT